MESFTDAFIPLSLDHTAFFPRCSLTKEMRDGHSSNNYSQEYSLRQTHDSEQKRHSVTLPHDTSNVAEEPNSTGKPHKYISGGYSQERHSGRNNNNAKTCGMKELGISFQVEGRASAESHGDMFERQT